MRWPFRPKLPMIPIAPSAQSVSDVGGYQLAEDPDLAPVIAALENNQAILATKLYREITGLGLKDAKDAVDTIGDQLSS